MRIRRSTDKTVEGYDVALSYDGINYGDSVSVIIYDEDCFACCCEKKLSLMLLLHRGGHQSSLDCILYLMLKES
jgi:hypothetical protein